jgi:hypothetical protein
MKRSSPLRSLDVWEVAPGWDTIQAYALIRGRIKLGHRRKLSDGKCEAQETIDQATAACSDWPTVRLRKPVRNMTAIGVGFLIHPLDDNFGLDVGLVALADEMHGPGGWRMGSVSAQTHRFAAKVRRGKVLAIIAPARRSVS